MESFFRYVARRSIPVAVLFMYAIAVWGQSPAVSITFPAYQYAEHVQSLGDVDFRNFSYPSLYDSGEPYQLHNGSYKDEAAGHLEVTLNHAWRFGAYALVSLDVFSAGGSSSNYGLMYLFGLKAGRPVIQQQFVYDLQANGSGAWFNDKTRSLTIKARSSDDSPHCCARHLDIATYVFQGDNFELLKSRTVPVASK